MIAITRTPANSLSQCELQELDRSPIDPSKAQQEHLAYRTALEELDVTVINFPPLEAFPDSVFIEDTAFVLPELAVLTRPGVSSRMGEVEHSAQALEAHRRLAPIEKGTLDGGDMLQIGRQLFIGLSKRTNSESIEQVAQLVEPFGYQVIPVQTQDCLHLKTGCSTLDDRTVLINTDWIDPEPFKEFKQISTDPREPFGSNTLRIGKVLMVNKDFSHTNERLVEAGYRLRLIGLDTLSKAEAGLSCLSLLFF